MLGRAIVAQPKPAVSNSVSSVGRALCSMLSRSRSRPIAVEVCSVQSCGLADLFESERGAVRAAVQTRVRDFAAGRSSARKALRHFVDATFEIPVGPGREPCWPSGFVGSISHSGGIAAAAVAPSSSVGSLGIDIECGSPLPTALRDVVSHPLDYGRATHSASNATGRDLKRLFCCKEALFKYQFPLTKRFLDFNEVSVVFDRAAQTFEATTPLLGELSLIKGHYREIGTFIVAAIHGPLMKC